MNEEVISAITSEIDSLFFGKGCRYRDADYQECEPDCGGCFS